MSNHRLPFPLFAILCGSLGLMLLLALPAFAQVAAVRPIAAPKPVDRISIQKRTPLVLAPTRAEADAIALGSPSLREGARRLKQRGTPATLSLPALRSVFRASERDNYQGLLAAAYTRNELLDATQLIDKLDPAALRARLTAVGESDREAAIQLARLHPGLTFDVLFELMRVGASADVAFTTTAEALNPSVDQIAAIGARYQQSRQFAAGNGRFFPEAEAVAAVIRARHPGTPRAVLWSRLLAVGYAPDVMFSQVAVGDYDRTGRALDAVASCIAQRFPNRSPTANPTVAIAIALDNSASHDPRQAECYATFLQALRGQSVQPAIAAQLAESFVTCVPAPAPSCPAERTPVVRSILDGAGFPAERR
jgi:hypothetical protein